MSSRIWNVAFGVLAAALVVPNLVQLHAQQTGAPGGQMGAPGTPGAPGRGAQGRGGRGGGGGFTHPEQMDFNNNEGWTSLFDGKTLNNWEGNPDVFHVEDGSIVAVSTPEKPSGTTNIIYRGGEFANFALKMEIKIEGNANGGIQFRSSNAPPQAMQIPADRLASMTPQQQEQMKQMQSMREKNAKWNLKGYQADLDGGNMFTGQIYEQDSPRGIIAWRGDFVETEKGQKPFKLGSLGTSDELKAFIKPGDWNQFVVLANGNQLTVLVNGHVTSGLIDNDPNYAAAKGLIGMEIEGTGRIFHRNIYIKPM